MARRASHVAKKGRGYWARMGVPADVRPAFGGAKWLQVSLHETDERKAELAALPIVAEWEARIQAAREARIDPIAAKIDDLAERFETYRGDKPLDRASHELLLEYGRYLFQEYGGLSAFQQATALLGQSSVYGAAQQTMRNPPAIWQPPQGHTPFLIGFESWVKYLTGRKAPATIKQYQTIMKDFAKAHGNPSLETLTSETAQKWFELELDKPGKNGLPMSYETAKRKKSALNSYWENLVKDKVAAVKDRANPFDGLILEDKRTDKQRVESQRVAFPIDDVPTILARAERDYGFYLKAACLLSVYMGWRLGEVCTLRVVDVREEDGVRYIYGGEKTINGIRSIPIHPDIEPLVDWLKANAKNGYLIHGLPSDQTEPTGRNFTALKQAMGYGPQYAFHCWRHTYCTLLERAIKTSHVSPWLVADLMGHRNKANGKKNRRDTTGLYIADSTLAERREALIAALPSFITQPQILRMGSR